MKRSKLNAVVVVSVALVLGFGQPACAEDTESVESMSRLRALLVAVPAPDLSPLDAMVAQQLTIARAEMEAAIADPRATPRELASAYGVLGQIYHAYEILNEARACYSNAIVLEPQNFAWVHLLADVSRLAGRLEDALTEFETAVALAPLDFAALVNMGRILTDLDREEEARRVFLRAMALSPGSPSVMAGLGQLALRKGEYEDAVAFFTAALSAVPDANRLHYSLAMAYRGLGQMENARIHLEQRGTVGVRPHDPLIDSLQSLREGERVHLVRGRLAFAAERYEEAKTEFEIAVRADPQSVRALVNLGATLAKLGDYDGAIKRFEQAIAVEPANLVARFNLGSLLAERGEHEAAVPQLRLVAEGEPHDAVAHLTLARSLAGSGNLEESLTYFRQSAEIDPGSIDAVVEGAAALVRLDRYRQAVSVLEAGFERIPEKTRIAYSLARLLATCPDPTVRNPERALALSLALQESNPRPQYALLIAQALGELGQCDEAAEWQAVLVDRANRDQMTEVADGLTADLEIYRRGPPCSVVGVEPVSGAVDQQQPAP